MCKWGYAEPAHMIQALVGLCALGSPMVFGSNGQMIIQWGSTSMRKARRVAHKETQKLSARVAKQ
jgi:hypothetical protein